MKEQRPFNHPHPTPNTPRPKQPACNPQPGGSPEANKAKAVTDGYAKQDAKPKGVVGQAISHLMTAFKQTAPTYNTKQDAGAIADKTSQARELKKEY